MEIEIAKKVNGNIEGNSKVELFALSKIEEAEQGSITFHPSGLPHGPHPGKIEESIGKDKN